MIFSVQVYFDFDFDFDLVAKRYVFHIYTHIIRMGNWHFLVQTDVQQQQYIATACSKV